MSKYKLGDKFVIEIGTILGGGGKYLIKGFNTLCFDDNGLDRLDRIDRHTAEGVWNAGYKTGYDKGYQEGALNPSSIGYEHGYEAGLNDAWECARELVHSRAQEEWDIMCDLFSVEHGRQCDIIAKTTASEAIEKLREYEANKDKIKVGDEVRLKDFGLIGVVTRLADLEQAACIMFDDGSATWKSVNGAKKTGRHFPIKDILEQMRSE